MLSGICASARSWVVTKPIAPRCTNASTTNRGRSREQLVQQKQYRDLSLRRVRNQLETLDLGVESRNSALQGIQNTNRCANREPRHTQPFRSDGRSALR